MLCLCYRKMPSFLHNLVKREVAVPVSEVEKVTESSVDEATQPGIIPQHEPQPESPPTEMGIPLSSAEPGGEHLQKHIFGNKTYHPSHGRTTPFPEPGISLT